MTFQSPLSHPSSGFPLSGYRIELEKRGKRRKRKAGLYILIWIDAGGFEANGSRWMPMGSVTGSGRIFHRPKHSRFLLLSIPQVTGEEREETMAAAAAAAACPKPPRFVPPDSGPSSLAAIRCCPCGRRHLLGASLAALLPILPTKAAPPTDPTALMERFHPPRPEWYEELFAKAMDQGMRSYEAQVAGYKAGLFHDIVGKSRYVLELGVGTGPNFKYYASAAGLSVVGVDPNKQMEKYALAAAVAAGLSSKNFTFMQGVGEALPVSDNSMDAVIGTLVLCSVKDVDMALTEVKRVLKPGGLYLFIEHVAGHDGSFLRLMQSVLDPLQQFAADGCHLTRETGKKISEAGFSSVNLNIANLSNVCLLSPHIYGTASK